MNNQTDDLLSELDNLRREDAPAPSSQADHLLDALKSANGLSQEETVPDEHTSPDHDLDEMDDLLEFMNDDFEETSEQDVQTPSASSAPISEDIQTTHTSSQSSHPKTTSKQATSDDVSGVESVALALEAAKTAQEAAENSQKATEMAIKNAHELKAEVVELSDSNYAWRQAVKNANKEIHSAKNTVSILATISIVFSFAAAGVMGYYLYSLNKKYEQLKGEVLDIIQTESTLFQKKFNTKVDELSSLIEFLNSKVDKLSKNGLQATHITPVTIHSSNETQETLPTSEQVSQHPTQIVQQTAHKHHAPLAEEAPVQNQSNQEGTHSDNNHTHINPEALEELNQIVQKILHKQQALESLVQQTLHATQQNTHRPTTNRAHAQTIMAKLSPEDEKKLAAIRWLIKVQNEKIKAIQHALKKGTKQEKESEYMQLQTTLKAIQQQVQNLQNQQNELKSEVQSLKEETQKLSIHRPYYYRAPKDEM